jgi:hypothetical protein
MEVPYLNTNELADLFGLTVKSFHQSIYLQRFPVPTYKLGKHRVADKLVVAAYFDRHRAAGLKASNSERLFSPVDSTFS